MSRAIFTVASGLSLILCVASAALWVRGYRVADAWEWSGAPGQLLGAHSELGRFGIVQIDLRQVSQWVRLDIAPGEFVHRTHAPGRNGLEFYGARSVNDWRFAGFGYSDYDYPALPMHFRVVVVPCWFVAVATAAMPALWLARAVRRRRRRFRLAGTRCVTCGYSLVGNLSGVCPECGTPVPAAPPPSAA